MKTITCLDCDKEFTGHTPEEVQKQMHPHYMEEHKDVMAEGTEEKRKEWFERFNERWANTPDV